MNSIQDQNNEPNESGPHSVWTLTRRRLRTAHTNRPVSFYLMLAMLAAVCLGAPMLRAIDDPKRFAFYLSLYFIFFLVVLCRAVYDFFEIGRRHFKEREEVFRETLGEKDFVSHLSQRVAAQKAKKK